MLPPKTRQLLGVTLLFVYSFCNVHSQACQSKSGVVVKECDASGIRSCNFATETCPPCIYKSGKTYSCWDKTLGMCPFAHLALVADCDKVTKKPSKPVPTAKPITKPVKTPASTKDLATTAIPKETAPPKATESPKETSPGQVDTTSPTSKTESGSSLKSGNTVDDGTGNDINSRKNVSSSGGLSTANFSIIVGGAVLTVAVILFIVLRIKRKRKNVYHPTIPRELSTKFNQDSVFHLSTPNPYNGVVKDEDSVNNSRSSSRGVSFFSDISSTLFSQGSSNRESMLLSFKSNSTSNRSTSPSNSAQSENMVNSYLGKVSTDDSKLDYFKAYQHSIKYVEREHSTSSSLSSVSESEFPINRRSSKLPNGENIVVKQRNSTKFHVIEVGSNGSCIDIADDGITNGPDRTTQSLVLDHRFTGFSNISSMSDDESYVIPPKPKEVEL